jgi:ribosome-binding factor A
MKKLSDKFTTEELIVNGIVAKIFRRKVADVICSLKIADDKVTAALVDGVRVSIPARDAIVYAIAMGKLKNETARSNVICTDAIGVEDTIANLSSACFGVTLKFDGDRPSKEVWNRVINALIDELETKRAEDVMELLIEKRDKKDANHSASKRKLISALNAFFNS